MDAQRRVAAFVAAHELDVPPAHRVLDLVSEVGEVAKEVNESTGYGTTDAVSVAPDELGDTLFALLALADALDVDAGTALDRSLSKYEARLDESGTAGSS